MRTAGGLTQLADMERIREIQESLNDSPIAQESRA
jgi:hypothetical protein